VGDTHASCNSLSFLATTLLRPSFSILRRSSTSLRSSTLRVRLATVLCDNLSCDFVFSSALRAWMTPACKSARTLVVPPGESLFVCGEGEGVLREQALVGGGEVGGRSVAGRDLSKEPSSAKARAFPGRGEMGKGVCVLQESEAYQQLQLEFLSRASALSPVHLQRPPTAQRPRRTRPPFRGRHHTHSTFLLHPFRQRQTRR